MIDFINSRLKETEVEGRPGTGIKLSRLGEEEVEKRWLKSEKNGGYSAAERDMVVNIKEF